MFNPLKSLFVITPYFNPIGYARRRENYDLFIEGLHKAGVQCLSIECAFDEDDFQLDERLDVIRVRSKTLLWQKERLINLAASWLPSSCRYVAWLDCDIVFHNANWARDLIRLMGEYKVAQVWETCERKPQFEVPGYTPDIVRSFASTITRDPTAFDSGRYDTHGHTGYGWAMHRDIFDEVGLYEYAISGSADHFMSHAIFGQYNYCITNALKSDANQVNHLKDWGQRFFAKVQGRLGVVPGHIHHLWHGSAENRRYFLRMHDITDLGYSPSHDIISLPGQPLEWAPNINKPDLVEYFRNYFSSRREDG